MSQLEPALVYRRKLPHLTPTKATFFVTTILAEAIPGKVQHRWQEELRLRGEGLSSIEKSRFLFRSMEQFLDRAAPEVGWLTEPRVAQFVYDAIRYRDGRVYQLEAFTLMPNHMHLLFTMLETAPEDGPQNLSLAGILHSLKGFTGKGANLLLQRSGPFWQHESFDRVIRKGNALYRAVAYIQQNPVKAGLVSDWRQHPWTWSHDRFS